MKKTFYIWIGIVLFLAGFITSCIETIDLETSGEVKLITVNGNIHNGPGPYLVDIQYTGDFSQDQRGDLAPVEITDGRIIGSNGESSTLFAFGSGKYRTADPNFRGKVGVSYTLEFTLPDGSVYRSSEQELLPPITIDDIGYTIEKRIEILGTSTELRKTFVNYNVEFDVPENEDNVYLKWDFNGEYVFMEVLDRNNPLAPVLDCYIKDFIGFNKIAIFNGIDGQGRQTKFDDINEIEVTAKFDFLYGFMLYQKSVGREEYLYWEKVKELVERSGSLFEAPPGTFNGNITNTNDPQEEVMGYFSVFSSDTARVFIGPNETGEILGQCDIDNPTEGCIDCTTLNNSTLEKPPYWPF